MMPDSPIIIREAKREDASLLLDFIRKIAIFDKSLSSVEATEQKLVNQLFGSHPAAFVLFAEIEGQIVGYALYFLTFSSFLARPGIWLDDLYVDEKARGRGAGETLLTHLAKIAHKRGYGRIEWVTADDNAKALSFYQRHGAKVRKTERVLRLDGPAISRLAEYKL